VLLVTLVVGGKRVNDEKREKKMDGRGERVEDDELLTS
jgi:hypothetical protein